jgi:hypothetical protein
MRRAPSVLRYRTNLPPSEVQDRVRAAIDPRGGTLSRWLREPSLKDFTGSVDMDTFSMRTRGRNSWKPEARGRIAAASEGSLVTVEIWRAAYGDWMVPTLIAIYVVALAGAMLIYRGFPPLDVLAGATLVALGGVGFAIAGPRLAHSEEMRIAATLSRLFDASPS